jgi:hypothetical protein
MVIRAFASFLLVFCITSNVRAADDLLPSWNDGTAKRAILDFSPGSPTRSPDGKETVWDK